MAVERVLVTGAAGALGRVTAAHLRGRFRHLRLSDLRAEGLAPAEGPSAGEEHVACDLADAAAVERLLLGVDACVHLGAKSIEGDWPTIIASNILGVIHLFEAARKAGTQRVLFASSNHAIGFHPRSRRIDHTAPARPDSRYGLSKAFGEDTALYYANKHGIAAFCMRIGTCRAEPHDERALSTWQSYPDFCRLIDVGLTADYRYEIVYGVSANRRSWWDNTNAERLGYRPQDDAEAFAQALEGKVSPDPVNERFQGGVFCGHDFTGDIDRIV